MVSIDDAKEVARALAEKISPIAVIVFGSVGRIKRGNDLDILIVTDERDMLDRVGISLRDYYKRFAIDYFVVSLDTPTEKFRE